MSLLGFEPVHDGSLFSPVLTEFENIFQLPEILQNWVNEANMSQLA